MKNLKDIFIGDFDGWTMRLDKEQKLGVFVECFELIPQEKKLNLFRHAYQMGEYGFHHVTTQMLKEIYKGHQPQFKGVVTIYRGFGTKSTPSSKAYSWTTKKEVAEWFANKAGASEWFANKSQKEIAEYFINRRADQKYPPGSGEWGWVITAKVEGEKILDFLDERKESEVLVLPEHIEITSIERMQEVTK